MTVVASEVSPLNCRWLEWYGSLPVCIRPPEPPHRVSATECTVCEFWTDDTRPMAGAGKAELAGHRARPRSTDDDPAEMEACPRCGTHDVVLVGKDPVVQSFVCSICQQQWLATRPWPLLRHGPRDDQDHGR